MTCHHVALPGGGSAIVCGPTRRCRCGRKADLLCDWKVPARKSGTCDRAVCSHCAVSPQAGKDLCQDHAVALREWQARQTAARPASNTLRASAPPRERISR